jgi:gliding motility-associated-like protein
LLAANTGMASYLWLPANTLNDSIYAYASGTYILEATDANGCVAKDSVKIVYNPAAPPPPATVNDTICIGNPAHLTASTSGGYIIEWYLQPYGSSVINTGTSYTSPLLYQNTTYYVSVKDNTGCHSIRQPVNAFINLTSVTPTISATNTSLCVGDTLYLHANTVTGAAYHWSGPNNFTSSQISPQINSVTAATGGIYSLFITGAGCTSSAANLTVTVISVSTPTITNSNDSLCIGASLVLEAQAPGGANYSWTGPNNYISSSPTNTISAVANSNTGTYYVQTSVGLCKSSIDSIVVYVKPLPNAVISIKTTLCSGDSLILYAQPTPTNATIKWTGPAGFSSGLASPVIKPLTLANTGYYDCYCTLNGCTKKDSVKATVNALPASVVSDTFICGSGVSINATYPKTLKYLWSDGSTDSVHTIANSGTYWITYTLSTSCVFTNTFHIMIKEDQLTDTLPNIVTPNNDNKNDFIDFGKYNFSSMQIEIYDRWGAKIFESSDPRVIWRPDCTDGTYFYIISYRIACGSENDLKTLRGFITVIR